MLHCRATKTPAEQEDDALEERQRKAPQKKPPRYDLRKLPKESDPDLQGLDHGDDGDPDFSRKHQAHSFSRYMSLQIETAMPRSSRSPTTMPKLSSVGAKKMTAAIDRIASTVQTHYPLLGLPKKIAMDFAWSCDYIADQLERRAGLRSKTADFDPPQNFTESENIPNRFDAAEIGMESSGPIMQDPDEPYMGCFIQDEFDQLREVQQTGMFSNAKTAARLLKKLSNLLAHKGIKLPVRVAAEDEDEDEDENVEDEDAMEDAEEETASKKASKDYFGLLG